MKRILVLVGIVIVGCFALRGCQGQSSDIPTWDVSSFQQHPRQSLTQAERAIREHTATYEQLIARMNRLKRRIQNSSDPDASKKIAALEDTTQKLHSYLKDAKAFQDKLRRQASLGSSAIEMKFIEDLYRHLQWSEDTIHRLRSVLAEYP